MADGFEDQHDYLNTYLLVVDAKGHSEIVRQNDADAVDRAFDAFEAKVAECVDEAAKRFRCSIASLFGWQGDGGVIAFYDKDESVARRAAIDAAKAILDDMEGLNKKIERDRVNGRIHVKVSVTKGGLRFKQRIGSIHSKELNLCAHACDATPADTLSLDSAVYAICDREEREQFREAHPQLEGKSFFLFSRRNDWPEAPLEEWRLAVERMGTPRAGGVEIASDIAPVRLGLQAFYSQRALTSTYSDMLSRVEKSLWVMGVGLAGFQRDFRDMLPEIASRGAEIRLLIADPQVQVTLRDSRFTMPEWCDYSESASSQGDQNATNNASLTELVREMNSRASSSSQIQVRTYKVPPSFAMFRADNELLVSPYVVGQPSLKMPTFSVRSPGVLFDVYSQHFGRIWGDDRFSDSAL